jgi:NOL1/NOP2/sun family putative RNA methylase
MINSRISNEFIERWQDFYGETQTQEILSSLNQVDPRIIAPNTFYTNLWELKKLLEKRGFKFEVNSSFSCLITKYEPFNIVATPEYLAGLFSIQAMTSLIPPRRLKPSSKAIVADLAASPGIKTCFLAQEMKNKGSIIAFEKTKRRISALRSNISRMGVLNTVVLNCDSFHFPELQIKVNNILLDAPCSGTGLKLAKNKRLEQRQLTDISRQSKKQKRLLDNAWGQLKKGGTMVYSTCSLEPEEGEVQINRFLQRYPEQVELLPLGLKIGSSGYETKWEEKFNSMLKYSRRILPAVGFDGFFVALIRKVF